MKIKKFNEKMEISDFNEFDDNVHGDEVIALDYLKQIALDLASYDSFDGSIVRNLDLNFGAGEVGFVLESKNDNDINDHINHFNNYCKQFDWCDKESLTEYDEEIVWDAFKEKNGNIISAATEFDIHGNKIYIIIKLH